MKLLWRALGEHTGYTFSIFESKFAPGTGIPLHKHPFPEFFYVLEGNLSIGYWNNKGATEWTRARPGESDGAAQCASHVLQQKSVAFVPHSECVNVSPRANDEGCGASGWKDRLPAGSITQADLQKLTKSMERESDIPRCRLRLETMLSMVHFLSLPFELKRCTACMPAGQRKLEWREQADSLIEHAYQSSFSATCRITG